MDVKEGLISARDAHKIAARWPEPVNMVEVTTALQEASDAIAKAAAERLFSVELVTGLWSIQSNDHKHSKSKLEAILALRELGYKVTAKINGYHLGAFVLVEWYDPGGPQDVHVARYKG